MARPNLRQLAKRVGTISLTFDENTDRLLKASSQLIHKHIVEDTPIDTGKARSNWRISVATTPDTDVWDSFGAGDAAATGALAQGRWALKTPIPPGAPVFIFNNVQYIQRLNEGWSGQAPRGFVGIAMEKARVEREAILSSRYTGPTD